MGNSSSITVRDEQTRFEAIFPSAHFLCWSCPKKWSSTLKYTKVQVGFWFLRAIETLPAFRDQTKTKLNKEDTLSFFVTNEESWFFQPSQWWRLDLRGVNFKKKGISCFIACNERNFQLLPMRWRSLTLLLMHWSPLFFGEMLVFPGFLRSDVLKPYAVFVPSVAVHFLPLTKSMMRGKLSFIGCVRWLIYRR